MKKTRSVAIALFPLALLACACASRRTSSNNSNNANDENFLKSTLNASQFTQCETINSGLKLTVPVQNARFAWNDNAPVLLYEGIFREAIKTVWQPLNNRFKPEGDGIVIGQRGMPYVGDFQTASDAFESFWTNYRFKIPNTEMHAIAVEYLEKSESKNNIVKLAMPQNRNSTAQRAWLIPAARQGASKTHPENQKGMAHVIVRFVSVMPGGIENSQTTYTWYLLNAGKGIVKKMGDFQPSTNQISIEKFLFTSEIDDPIGVGVTNSAEVLDTKAALPNPRTSSNTTSIVAIRPFVPNSPTHVLHEDDRPLSSLAVGDVSANLSSAVVAWIRDPVDTPHPSVEWIASTLKIPGTAGSEPLGSRKRRRLVRNTNLKRIPLNYFPTQLEFANVFSQSSTTELVLSWWGGADSDQGFVFVPIYKTNKNNSRIFENAPQLKAVAPKNGLGSPMGATFFNRHQQTLVLTFAESPAAQNSAAPSTVHFCAISAAQLAL